MKSLLALGRTMLALASTHARAAIITLTDPSSGTYINQQSFTFDGATIEWSNSLPDGSAFFVQSFSMMGVFLDFGEWNNAPFLISASPLAENSSVKLAGAFNGQNHLYDSDALFENAYYGIRYDLGGGDTLYGWINLSTNSSGALINAVAFNDVANQDILAGQLAAIPEPAAYASSLALITGLCALFGRRRRMC